MKGTVFSGDVVERVNAQPKALKLATTSLGFPRSSIAISRAKPKVESVNSINPRDSDLSLEHGQEDMFQLGDSDSDANIQTVLSMTPEQLAEAISEISSIISPETMKLLTQQGLQNKKLVDQLSEHLQSAEGRSSSGANPTDPAAFPNINSLEDLERAKMFAPPEIKANLLWTIDEEEATTSESSRQSGLSSEAPLRKFPRERKMVNPPAPRSAVDRFDLKGCKVTKRDDLISNIAVALNGNRLTSHLFTSPAALSIFAGTMADYLQSLKLWNEPSEVVTQPQDELLMHQFDKNRPGYSLVEISEMFRSSVLSQRILAATMLTGILQNRDIVVSLEAYGMDDSVQDPSAYSCANYHEMSNSAKRLFVDLIGSVTSKIDTAVTAAEVARVIVFAMLQSCCSDLPSELPTLIAWNMQQRIPFPARLVLVKLFHAYIMSPWEELEAGNMWVGFGCLYGTPKYPIPHSRRSELTYEEWNRDCNFKKRVSIEEESESLQSEELEHIRREVYEQFALQSRWGRVDSFFQLVEEGLLMSVQRSVIDAVYHIDQLRDDCDIFKNALAVYSKSTASNATASGDSIIVAALLQMQIFQSILEVLAAAARNGNEGTVTLIGDEIVKKLWPKLSLTLIFKDGLFTDLVDSSRNQPVAVVGQLDALLQNLQWKFVKLVCLLCQRSYDFTCWLLNQNNSNDLLVWVLGYVVRTIASPDARSEACLLVWCLRLWRVCVAYEMGLTRVRDLILFGFKIIPSVQASHCSNLDAIQLALVDCMGCKCTDLVCVEFLDLLEQAVVSCSAVLERALDELSVTNPVQLDETRIDILSQVFTCIEAILAFAIRLVAQLSDKSGTLDLGAIASHANPSSHLRLSKVFHILASVIGIPMRQGDLRPAAASSESDCPLPLPVRGNGLLATCQRFAPILTFDPNTQTKPSVCIGDDLLHLSTNFQHIRRQIDTLCNSLFASSRRPVINTNFVGKVYEMGESYRQKWEAAELSFAVWRYSYYQLIWLSTAWQPLEEGTVTIRSFIETTVATRIRSLHVELETLPLSVASGIQIWQFNRLLQTELLCCFLLVRYFKSFVGLNEMRFRQLLSLTVSYTDCDILRAYNKMLAMDSLNNLFRATDSNSQLQCKLSELNSCVEESQQLLVTRSEQFLKCNFVWTNPTSSSLSRTVAKQFAPVGLADVVTCSLEVDPMPEHSKNKQKDFLYMQLFRLRNSDLMEMFCALWKSTEFEAAMDDHACSSSLVAADKLGTLLVLCSSKNSMRWAVIEDESVNSTGTQNQTGNSTRNPTQSFIGLLMSAFVEMQQCRHELVGAKLLSLIADEAFSVGDMLRADADSMPSTKRPSKSAFQANLQFAGRIEAGVTEFFDDLLTNCMHEQVLDEDIHAITLLIGLSTAIAPPNIRQMMWRELSKLRLLHLSEPSSRCYCSYSIDNGRSQSSFYFDALVQHLEAGQPTNYHQFQCAQTIVIALCKSLRDAAADYNMMVCAMGCCQVADYLFGSSEKESHLISGYCRKLVLQLLVGLIPSDDMDNDDGREVVVSWWVLAFILLLADLRTCAGSLFHLKQFRDYVRGLPPVVNTVSIQFPFPEAELPGDVEAFQVLKYLYDSDSPILKREIASSGSEGTITVADVLLKRLRFPKK